MAFVALVIVGQQAAAQTEKETGDCPNNVVVGFPTSGPAQTQWDICYEAIRKFGVLIRRARFRPSPASADVKVLADARVAEIFVPYHSGKPRYFDVKGSNYRLLTLTAKDCPPAAGGVLLAAGQVCREIRDSGVAWRNGDEVRRGQEVVLWGILRAGNYEYIMEWTFQDDGTLKAQVGSTGPTRTKSPTEGHMHNFTWRLDIDLNGEADDTVSWTTHEEAGGAAADSKRPIEFETSLVWNPAQFQTAEITDATLLGPNGQPTAYELTPLRNGVARHKEPFTKADFWVTSYKPTELLAAYLPTYLNGEPVNARDVVLWYTGSAHHENEMRDEDRLTVPVKWVGFTLKPKNLFAGTPLHP